MATESNVDADRRAIEALNQHDKKAALANDPLAAGRRCI